MTENKNVIHACWLDKDKDSLSWCEYCNNSQSEKTYLPLNKFVLNPERICSSCFENGSFKLIDFIEKEDEYRELINKLKNS